MIEWQWVLIEEVKLVHFNEDVSFYSLKDQQYLQKCNGKQ